MRTPALNEVQMKYLRLLAAGASLGPARLAVGGDCPFCPSPEVRKCPVGCPWSRPCAAFIKVPDRRAWVRAFLKDNGIPCEVYVGRRECGCIAAAAIDTGDRETLAQDVGEMVLQGLTVAKVPLPEGGITLDRCEHEQRTA